ncbi:hypothetical protein WMY93_032762 [Mugilogobius chulae]|uniref:NACHT domain-containing protein n=1 Tax=Mugilogobius chulae TaxID=88201 RepID=A0AAW0MTU8_9GOBI
MDSSSDSSSYNMDPPGPGPGSEPRPGPAPDSVSMRSDWSKDWDPDFKEARPEEQRPKPAPDSVSMRSDRSKSHLLNFREAPPEDQREPGPKEQLDAIFRRLEKDVLTFVKEQLQRLHRLLASDYPECSESEEEEQSSREAVLNITLDFLRRMDQEQLAQRLQHKTCKDKLKSHLQRRFSRVFEGVAKAGDSAPLNQIYTELYITEGGASEVNQEHEVRLLESASRRAAAPEKTITCEDIFKARPLSPEPIRAVLTKGVAGVGKTVLTQKFSLDWAEGRANQELQLLFPFTFRELNVLRDTQFSLVELLHHFFSPSKALCSFQQLQVLFIFDGLDECRLPLDFGQTRVLRDPTESVSVDVLLVNLIRGSLLPSALLWITTRPAAANQIPAVYVSMVTEVRGFTDLQKEQYFRKRFTDNTIISHIKSIRSLYIMSHIPMYVHFLVVQAKVQNIKYQQGSGADLHWTPETREMVLSLGKLAFEQLQKGNLIFYESDLSECGLDAAAASVYSGVFTQVFREEPGLYQDKVYCFIHLSVQEFLAALHVHQTFTESGVYLLPTSHAEIHNSSRENSSDKKEKHFCQKRKDKQTKNTTWTDNFKTEAAFYCSAVDQALQSPNGHLDLFLRFLLGLSLPTNQKLLKGLLTQSGKRSLNLLHCLNELNDHSLVEEIQEHVRGGNYNWIESPAQWSALSFLLLSSDSDLEEFDLRKYGASETALLGLLPVVKASTKALLIGCGLSPHCCGPLASVLSSSSLTHLDLSHNDLQDSGVELLCDGLKSAPCRLETLRLSGCLVSQRGGFALASALSSAHSHLTELDLSYNHPGFSAELLTALRDDPTAPWTLSGWILLENSGWSQV